ncbi:hypothetical protein ABH931_006179 [Streptacidiphilus sp. MAP12-33]|uniref:hypothetical protein n=1 Tax=Streptacidiphilus sp. MAP12-33 TaxID=3156266 RepID=UPI00351880CF
MASDSPQPRRSRSPQYRAGVRRGPRPSRGRRTAIGAVLVATSPLWLLIGYPLERTWGRLDRHRPLGFEVTRHPLAIALSAPMRFVSDRLRGRGPRRGPDAGPEPSGDREPRRPRPTPPGDSVSLSEPRS